MGEVEGVLEMRDTLNPSDSRQWVARAMREGKRWAMREEGAIMAIVLPGWRAEGVVVSGRVMMRMAGQKVGKDVQCNCMLVRACRKIPHHAIRAEIVWRMQCTTRMVVRMIVEHQLT